MQPVGLSPISAPRLLGKVMIRNTRSNVDITLPLRRAETIIFEPDAEEVEFRREWENELRSSLDAMSDNRARFWGRLLLQTIGSSPHAWNHALESFPDPDKAESIKRFEDRIEAAHVEEERRCQDQLHRYEIRLYTHLEALLMTAERAWTSDLSWRDGRRTHEESATFLARAHRWFRDGEARPG